MAQQPLLRHSHGQLEMEVSPGEWKCLTGLPRLNSRDDEAKLCHHLAEQYPLFSRATPAPPLTLPTRYYKAAWGEQLAFFGGSFFPWHQGHRACLDLCHARFPQCPIVVAPDRNPEKDIHWDCGPFERFQKLALELEDTPYSIYPGFMALDEANPTYRWVGHIAIAKLYFLMGDDNFLHLHRWQNYATVVQHLSGLWVCPRGGTRPQLEEQAQRLRQINRKLEIEFLPRHPWEALSSRELRGRE